MLNSFSMPPIVFLAAEEQERLLEESARELEAQRAAEAGLRQEMIRIQDEQVDIDEKYKSLEEEIAGKTKKMKKVFGMLMQAKQEIAEIQKERREQTDAMLDNIRELSRELRLSMLEIDTFIPPEYQDQIEQQAVCLCIAMPSFDPSH